MFDVLIVGAGPAGITAGIYAKRANKKVAIIEKLVPGGQVSLIGEIENYPGFSNINGYDLSMNFFKQATDLQIEFIFDEAVSFDLKSDVKKIVCKNGEYEAKAVILALGSASKELNVTGEKKFFGKGVSYCAMCDGNFFKGKNVAVVGSGDSSASNALYLADICDNVHIFAKGDLKLTAYTEQEILDKGNVKIHKNSEVKEIFGEEKLSGLNYLENGKEGSCDVDGIFVAIGRKPDTKMLEGQVDIDKKGYIIVNDKMETNLKGVYACGDVTTQNLKQIVVAASSGAIASTEALKYILKNTLVNRWG